MELKRGCELAASRNSDQLYQKPRPIWRLNESGYLKSSRTPLFGFIAVIPLLFFYEALVVTVNQAQVVEIRNGADVIFKTLLSYLGLHGPFAYGILLFGILILLLFLRRRGQPLPRLRYFLYMLMESGVYASFLGYAVGTLTGYVLSLGNLPIGTVPQLMLSLGAGVYEELVFRAFLFGTTAIALQRMFKIKPLSSYLTTALFSAILFSVFHYFSNEPFEFYSFLFRFFAGLLFCLIYFLRGYGIAVYTHTLYDLMIIL